MKVILIQEEHLFTHSHLQKTDIYGPLPDVSDNIVKRAKVGYVTGTTGSFTSDGKLSNPHPIKRCYLLCITKKLSRIMMV